MSVPKDSDVLYAVTQLSASCDDPDAHEADEGVLVTKLFSSRQLAEQWVDRRRDSWNGGSFRVTTIELHHSLKTAGEY